ncbi:hypothetical protein UQ36_24910, partial [Escherichia coli]
ETRGGSVFWAGVPLIFLSCVSLSLLSALLIILIPVITINYTINYTDRCTKGYNVKQAGTRKITNLFIIKNIMNNLKHYETAKNTN